MYKQGCISSIKGVDIEVNSSEQNQNRLICFSDDVNIQSRV